MKGPQHSKSNCEAKACAVNILGGLHLPGSAERDELHKGVFPELQGAIAFYNTLTRAQEPFRPLNPPHVGIYCCGPTVYNFQHIGNLRTYIFEDVLVRSLRSSGYRVNHVMNTTDVGHLVSDADAGEDKMLVAAKREGKKSADIAAFYTERFFADCAKLNILPPTTVCPATKHISNMIELIERLMARGVAYESAGNVYFDVTKFPEYGKLAGLKLDQLMAGARIEPDPHKRNPYDFALWFTRSKFEGQELQWDSPWGVGYPGWHIECSAMAMKYLGEAVDIHCGGTDHIGVHHTNEIAQVEGATGEPWVRTWMHGAFLVDQEGKMSKSKGKFLTVETIEEQGISPLGYRYFCLGTHYRKPLSFSWDALRSAVTGYQRLRKAVEGLQAQGSVGELPQAGGSGEGLHQPGSVGGLQAQGSVGGLQAQAQGIAGHRARFLAAVANDLNMPQALAVTWELVGDAAIPEHERRELIGEFDTILGLDLLSAKSQEEPIPEEIVALVARRNEARKARDFGAADTLRKEVEERGYIIEDLRDGSSGVRSAKDA